MGRIYDCLGWLGTLGLGLGSSSWVDKKGRSNWAGDLGLWQRGSAA